MLACDEELRRQARDGNYINDEQGELRRQAHDANWAVDGEGQLGQRARGAKEMQGEMSGSRSLSTWT